MAIGLEKWNELENMEITPELIKKMRKLKNNTGDSDDDDEDNEADEVQSREQESGDVPPKDSPANSIEADSVASESDVDAESEDDALDSFEYCPICPGKKFLTERDAEEHRKSAKHMKRESALLINDSQSEKVQAKAGRKDISGKSKLVTVETPCSKPTGKSIASSAHKSTKKPASSTESEKSPPAKKDGKDKPSSKMNRRARRASLVDSRTC
jgi:hypothetical protein